MRIILDDHEDDYSDKLKGRGYKSMIPYEPLNRTKIQEGNRRTTQVEFFKNT